MANEVLTSGLERSADVRVTQYVLTLADRAYLNPASSGHFFNLGNVANTGTHVLRGTTQGLMGHDLMTAAGSEVADVANTAYTGASATVTVGRYSLSYDMSSLAIGTDNILNPSAFYQSILASSSATATNAAAALMDGFSGQVGASGVTPSLATLLAGASALELANVPGAPGYLAILHSSHFAALRLELLLSVGGAMQWREAPNVTGVPTGYKGSIAGIDIFVANRGIATSGSDYKSGIIGEAALGYAYMTPIVEDASRQAVMGDTMVEYNRVAGAAQSEYHGHKFFGLSEYADARGYEIIGTA